MTLLPRQRLCFCCVRDSLVLPVLSLSAAAACISIATSRGVLGPLSGDDSCKPLVQFKGWLECLNCFRTPITTQTNEISDTIHFLLKESVSARLTAIGSCCSISPPFTIQIRLWLPLSDGRTRKKSTRLIGKQSTPSTGIHRSFDRWNRSLVV